VEEKNEEDSHAAVFFMPIGDIQCAWVAVRMENKVWWLGFLS
jgi:hypothetical protein